MSVDMSKWTAIAKENIHNRPAGTGRLAGKITIVTGAAQGFGKGIAEELYAEGAISFGSAVAGLSAGTGLGLLVLFRSDADKAHCFRVALMLFAISVLTGMVLQFTVG